MGRKKQKVRWTTVEDAGFFDTEQDQNQPQIIHPESTNLEIQDTMNQEVPATDQNTFQQYSYMKRVNMAKYSHNGTVVHGTGPPPPRRSGFWSSNNSLPPRFERSKAMMQQVSTGSNGSSNHSYYSTAPHYMSNTEHELDSNYETEELPNGFTKIRSKNLDVLFRKDYYAQRMLSTTSSSAVSSEAGEAVGAVDDLEVINNMNNTEPVAEENEEDLKKEQEQGQEPKEQSCSSDEKEHRSSSEPKEQTPPPSSKEGSVPPAKKEEPVKKEIKSKINTNAVPFYPSSYIPPPPPVTNSYPLGGGAPGSTGRPSLFLYSPTSNTMIPCEEIIIPNAVMPGTDVYQGPSNIYLAFPTPDQTPPSGSSPNGSTGVASPGSTGNSATSPGTSANCTPPQAQSPPSSYEVTGNATPTVSGTTPTTMVQYDHYGVPYTTYTPVMPITTTTDANSGSNSAGGVVTSSGTESADSTTPHSPPDLSVYNPANWVQDPAYLAANQNGQQLAHHHVPGPHPYQYYPYYTQQQPTYYNFRNGHASYQYFVESSAVPSSAGDSQNEDRSEGEETGTTNTTTPNTAATTTSNSPKKDGGVALNKRNESEPKIFIPGLPVNLKRPTKKRRKKKSAVAGSNPTNGTLLGTGAMPNDQHRGSSSSEACFNEKNNVLQAINILQRAESEEPSKVIEPELEPDPEPEVETKTADSGEFEKSDVFSTDEPLVTTTTAVEIKVNKEGEEEVLVTLEEQETIVEPVTNHIPLEPEIEPQNEAPEASSGLHQSEEWVPEVSSKPPRPHRRRRGARKSEKNKKIQAAAVVNNQSESVTNPMVQSEETHKPSAEPKGCWEDVPKDIIDPDAGWEMATRKGGRSWVLHATPLDSCDATPNDLNRVSISSDLPVPESQPANQESEISSADLQETEETSAPPVVEVESPEIMTESQISSSSAPVSRKSTLKRSNRKKRSSLDGSEKIYGTSQLSKPVLISDRDYDVASAVAAQRRQNKSAFEILDETKIQDLVNNPSGATGENRSYDTLYISDIGHGMTGGPISVGRFGLGKYVPPDRSDEILPIPEDEKDGSVGLENSSETENLSGSDSKAQKSIIKAMMEEIIRGNESAASATSAERLTYIRDAERFTEIKATGPTQPSTASNHGTSTCAAEAAKKMAEPAKSSAAEDIDLD